MDDSKTLIVFSPIWYILKKYVKYKTAGIVCFFLLVYYFVFFAALRQIISLSLILWGVIYVLENKKYKWFFYIAICILAYFFHTTTAVVGSLFLVLYFIPIKSKIIPYVAILGSAIVGVILDRFNVLDIFQIILAFDISLIERVDGYFENSELNDIGALNLTLRVSVVALISFYYMDKEKVNHWFSKIYLAGVIMYNLFSTVPEIGRMVVSNLMFVIVVLPWLFESKNYKKPKVRQIMNILLLLLLLYFGRSYIKGCIGYDVKSANRMHPYYFIFEDYSSHPSIRYF